MVESDDSSNRLSNLNDQPGASTIDEGRVDTVSSPGSAQQRTQTSSGGGKWRTLLTLVLAVGLIGGAGAWWMAGGEEPEDEEPGADVENTGFEPYQASGAEPDGDDEEFQGAALGAREDDEPVAADDDGEEDHQEDADTVRRPTVEDVDRHFDGDSTAEIDDSRVIGRSAEESDDIIEDSRGEPISEREARERLERELDSMEEGDEHYRRLRRRDAQLNSRVLRPREGDVPEVVPGIELSEDLQERISNQFDPDAIEQDTED